jgi:hypothetical protein
LLDADTSGEAAAISPRLEIFSGDYPRHKSQLQWMVLKLRPMCIHTHDSLTQKPRLFCVNEFETISPAYWRRLTMVANDFIDLKDYIYG